MVDDALPPLPEACLSRAHKDTSKDSREQDDEPEVGAIKPRRLFCDDDDDEDDGNSGGNDDDDDLDF